jgi:hypothetical protein
MHFGAAMGDILLDLVQSLVTERMPHVRSVYRSVFDDNIIHIICPAKAIDGFDCYEIYLYRDGLYYGHVKDIDQTVTIGHPNEECFTPNLLKFIEMIVKADGGRIRDEQAYRATISRGIERGLS